MYDEQHFTRDAAAVRFHEDADGITIDEDSVAFDWDEVETVAIDDPPHAEAFDSKEFYKLPATVAKPIPQPYDFGSDSVTWLKKPREELKKAAWSLDNAPWTMGHPDSGMVKSVDDVRGFWRNPRYIDALDDLDSDLHVPVNDEEAKEHIEENGDVSVGFYNRIARVDAYDGVVGGADDDGVDIEGYQTDMLFDHVASVSVGRCPASEGCGLDDVNHGHMDSSFKRDTVPTHSSDEDEGGSSASDGTDSMQETTDAPSGIHVAGDRWFAVGPDEHPDDSTEYADDAKFPVGSCESVQDAWNLRGTGDISIDESTLEARIERAAEAQDCDLDTDAEMDAAAVADSAKRYSVCGARKHVMVTDSSDESVARPDSDDGIDQDDGGCGCDNSDDTTTMTEENGINIDLDDLSTEAALSKVEEQHDGVSEYLDNLRQYEDAAEEAEEAADELELDDVQDLADSVGVLKEQKETLDERLDEALRPQMEEDAEEIASRTDRFGEDAEDVIENLDEDPETIAEKRELVEDLTEGYDEQTANPGDEGESGSTDARASKYAKTPWE